MWSSSPGRAARPPEFVETSTDYSACRLQVALHQKPHGDGGGVPTARRQSPKEAFSRGRFVEMKRLRIELRGEGLNFLISNARSTGAEGLPHHEIFEVSLRYRFRRVLDHL